MFPLRTPPPPPLVIWRKYFAIVENKGSLWVIFGCKEDGFLQLWLSNELIIKLGRDGKLRNVYKILGENTCLQPETLLCNLSTTYGDWFLNRVSMDGASEVLEAMFWVIPLSRDPVSFLVRPLILYAPVSVPVQFRKCRFILFFFSEKPRCSPPPL
jgi:hypothetical protein